jgi:hemoglobin
VSDTPQQQPAPTNEPEMITIFEAAGGLEFFGRLVQGFYRRVEADPVLLEMYPDPENLEPSRQRLTLFLAQYWGGPETYSQQRGHPRLRMRHFPYAIGRKEADHWLAAMTAALDELDPHPILRERFDAYFTMSAEAMMNQPEAQGPGQGS